VVFFGYNRADHATWALESFKNCPEASATPLTIYMDGPKDDDGVEAVEVARRAVQAAAPSHANIILREENLGLANSIRTGVTEACEEYGRVIVVEDDLILSPVALQYFNAGLDRYEDSDKVMHIAGFWPEAHPDLPPSFFLRWPGVWGWATWAKSWATLEWDLEILRDAIVERELVDHFSEGGWDFFSQLVGTFEGDYDSWGIRWYGSVLLEGGLALHPRESLVSNTGTDGSGVHGDESEAFHVTLGSSVPEFPREVAESAEAVSVWSAFNDRRTYRSIPRRVYDRLADIATRLVAKFRRVLSNER
jgi:hypothetical protein